jgi:hypothetical protein
MRRWSIGRLVASTVVLALSFGAACGDGADDLLEEACDVVAKDCGAVRSSSECVDLLGSESTACLECIVFAGCDYAEECDTDGPCRLPRDLLP